MLNRFASILLSICMLLAIFSTVEAQSNTTYPQYIIQPGDNLGVIAERFGVTPQEIIQLNNIQNPDLLSPGQVILIPGLEGITGTLTTITVQLGESLGNLSSKYDVTEDQIITLNHITSPSEICAGAKLLVSLVAENQVKSPFVQVSNDSTLLEASVQKNLDPWDLMLVDQSRLSSVQGIDQVFYKILSDGESTISMINPGLSQVSISPLPLVQGETFVIQVNSINPATLKGELAGNKLSFFSLENNQYFALQGIYAMADPGVYQFQLSGTLSDGTSFSYEQPILLVSGDYSQDSPLTVDPSTIDPTVTQPELELVQSLISKITPVKYWTGIFQSPGQYYEFNSLFGVRRSYNGSPYEYFHTGLDYAGGMGLPISAPADGVVVFAGPLTVRGNATFIDHGWGVYSGFFHQSQINVKVGDKVTKGQVIGLVGNSGRVDGANEYEGAGAHLHWEIWVSGVQVNPFTWLNQEYPR